MSAPYSLWDNDHCLPDAFDIAFDCPLSRASVNALWTMMQAMQDRGMVVIAKVMRDGDDNDGKRIVFSAHPGTITTYDALAAEMDARLQLEKAALAAWCNGPLPLWLKERVTQTRLHTEEVNGNCMAACFASVLGGDISEYDAIIDAVIGGNWWHAVEELWRSHGYLIMRISASASDWSGGPDALCFASGTSPRGVRHMCVYAGGEIIHDPHPSRAGLTEITDYSILVPWKELTTPTREGATDGQ